MTAVDTRQLVRAMAGDLRALGVREGGTLLVHSSLASLTPGRHLPGGAETVIQGLLEALGPQGTLVLPALSHMSVGPFSPFFDVKRTPSCVGSIPEHFRTRLGVRRSVNPTHSFCAIGPGAEQVLGEHDLDETPCGAHSPLVKVREARGQLLMLGCGLRPNTSMHAIEQTVEAPYLFRPDSVKYRVTLADGRVIYLLNRVHSFSGVQQRYDRLGKLLAAPALREGPVLGATVQLIEVQQMWEQAQRVLRRDVYSFVDRIA